MAIRALRYGLNTGATLTGFVPLTLGDGRILTYSFFGNNGLDSQSIQWSGYWRANYSASPWAGETSAGVSGSRNISDGTYPPVTGTTQNGYTPAGFTSSPPRRLATSAYLIDYLGDGTTSTGWTVSVLVKFNALPGADASYFDEPLLFGSDAGNLSLTVGASGIRLAAQDTAGATVLTPRIAVVTGQYYKIQAQWTGTNIRIRVDGGAWTTGGALTTYYSADFTGGKVKVGANYNNSVAPDADFLEVSCVPQVLSDAVLNDLNSYYTTRYALGGASISATGVATYDATRNTGTAGVRVAGTAAVTFAGTTNAGTAGVRVSATGSAQLVDWTNAGSVTVGDPPVTGQGVAVYDATANSGTVGVRVSGTGVATYNATTNAASAGVRVAGQGASTGDATRNAGTAGVRVSATGASVYDATRNAGSVTVAFTPIAGAGTFVHGNTVNAGTMGVRISAQGAARYGTTVNAGQSYVFTPAPAQVVNNGVVQCAGSFRRFVFAAGDCGGIVAAAGAIKKTVRSP